MHAIGIDVGTTNVKAVLVDDEGGLLAAAGRPLVTTTSGDTVGQDANDLWAAVVEAVKAVTAADPRAAAAVRTLGVCSQYSSIVPVGSDGTALARMKLYLDHRGGDDCWEIMERHPEAFETWVARHGIPPIGAGLSLSHLLHFQHAEPAVHERTAVYLEAMDLVNMRLTGRAAATQCTTFTYQLCDNRTVGTTSYDDGLVAMSGVDADRLPPLIPVDGTVGPLLPDVAELLGLRPDVVVRAAMNDTQAGAFATGALANPRRTGLMVGTTGVLIRSMPGFEVDLDHEILSMPAPIPHRFVLMAENGIAGRAVERVLDVLAPPGSGDTADQRFAELDAALATSPVGAGGVMFLPWLAGSMSPSSSPEMRGGFLGMSLGTERPDLLRATVEGVARNLRWLADPADALSGTEANELTFAGGGARSAGMAQTIADVFGLPVSVPEQPEVAAARAVAMVAQATTRGNDPAAISLPIAATFEPDPAATDRHRGLQDVFEAAYSATAPICQSLA